MGIYRLQKAFESVCWETLCKILFIYWAKTQMLQKTHLLLVANSENSLEANAEKAMDMFMCPEKVAGHNHNKIKMSEFKDF